MIPWIGGTKAGGEVGAEASKQRSLESEFIGYDLAEAQAITELLTQSGYKKFVVLENFHYLPVERQKSIAFDLKTFHEVGIRFIILGIWQEANLLLMHNGDLQDRVVEIPVEPWEDEDFDRLIAKGAAELRIDIPQDVVREFKHDAYGNVGMLQEFLKTYCEINNIAADQTEMKHLADGEMVEKTFNAKLASQKGRLVRVLEGIAGKSRADNDDALVLPYYLVQVLLTAPIPELRDGISRQHLLEKVRALHHRSNKDTVRLSDIAHLLTRLPALQEDVQPPFLYYDSNQQRLRIVDTTQFFVLARTDREAIRQEIVFPLKTYDE